MMPTSTGTPTPAEASNEALTASLKAEALAVGFDRVGVCAAAPTGGFDRFRAWLAAGYGGQMQYLTEREAAYAHPRHVLDGVRSLVMLAMGYRTRESATVGEGSGRISRYAWGDDYHDLIHQRFKRLVGWLEHQRPGARVRGVVDTAPLLEREWAQLAGLGWIGKNTLLLDRELGSWFFLAALLTDLELVCDEPFAADHCGTCRACLDACPTGAFVDAYVLDARRCLSYLSIELRAPVPGELRPQMGDWLFGCDVCQEVCPWCQRGGHSDEPALAPREGHDPLELAGLFALDEAAFRQRFRDTPLWRPRRRGLLRNAALVLGNQRATSATAALIRGLADDEPLVRGACAWALGRLATSEAQRALEQRLPGERDSDVRQEIAAAIAAATSGGGSA